MVSNLSKLCIYWFLMVLSYFFQFHNSSPYRLLCEIEKSPQKPQAGQINATLSARYTHPDWENISTNAQHKTLTQTIHLSKKIIRTVQYHITSWDSLIMRNKTFHRIFCYSKNSLVCRRLLIASFQSATLSFRVLQLLTHLQHKGSAAVL